MVPSILVIIYSSLVLLGLYKIFVIGESKLLSKISLLESP